MEIQLEARELPNMDFGSLSDPFSVLDVMEGSQWVEFGKYIYMPYVGICFHCTGRKLLYFDVAIAH